MPERDRTSSGTIPVYGSAGIVGRHSSAITYAPTIVVGRKGSAGSVYLEKSPCWPIDTAYFTAPLGDLHLEYCYHLLRSLRLSRLDQSTAVPSLGRDNYNKVWIRLPPAPEQRRIAEKIDELFGEIEAGEQELEKAREGLAAYRRSLLKAAVTGQLTREWREKNPPTETGADLLKRILVERRAAWERAELAKLEAKGKKPKDDGWKARYVEPAPPDTSDLPDLPPGWVWISLDHIAVKMTSGSRAWASYYDRGECVFIMAQNVRPGRFDRSHRQYVDPPLDDPERQRTNVEKADILITIVGANTGDVCRVDVELRDHFVCQSVALIRLVNPELAGFVETYLLAKDGGQRDFAKYIYGAGRPHLSFDQLRSVRIPLPPVEEQAAIVEVCDGVIAIIEQLEHESLGARSDAARLRQSILAAAFSGKLVPQDPNDEPAGVLLERLRAAKAEAAGATNKRKVAAATGKPSRAGRKPRKTAVEELAK